MRDPLVSAFSHEVRRAIFGRMLRQQNPVSPTEIADALDHPLSNISYHFRCLLEAGAIALDRTEASRGSIQHFYVANAEVTSLAWVRGLVLGMER